MNIVVKNYYVNSLFLKKNTHINEAAFNTFINFLTVDSEQQIDVVDMGVAVSKDKVIELKKSFYSWIRSNRFAMQSVISKKFKTKSHFTKYFQILKKKKSSLFELTYVGYLFLKSHLIWTLQDYFFLVINSFVYKNGVIFSLRTSHLSLQKTNFFQLYISKAYFYSYIYFLDYINDLKFKLSNKILNLKKKSNDQFKQKKQHNSAKFNRFLNLLVEVPHFLEVDFFTLSFFVLNSVVVTSIFNFTVYSSFFFKSYNWGSL